MSISVIEDVSSIRDISSELLLPNGKLKLLPAIAYKQFTREEIKLFCHYHARYGLPTIELVEYLKKIINNRSVIEIGAGHGDLGYHLGIPMTDSKMQSKKEIRKFYDSLGQPIINYPNDVEKLEALAAIKKYKPEVVVGSWITRWVNPKKPCSNCSGSMFGVKENQLLRLVDTYILVGNIDIHGAKPICNRPHLLIEQPWILSRATNPEKNKIFIWSKAK